MQQRIKRQRIATLITPIIAKFCDKSPNKGKGADGSSVGRTVDGHAVGSVEDDALGSAVGAEGLVDGDAVGSVVGEIGDPVGSPLGAVVDEMVSSRINGHLSSGIHSQSLSQFQLSQPFE